MWKLSSWYDKAHTKKAILLTGWAKTEKLKNYKNKFKTILYAPCFETDNKGVNVIDAIKDTNIRLLIKHLPGTRREIKKFKDVRENIKKINIRKIR